MPERNVPGNPPNDLDESLQQLIDLTHMARSQLGDRLVQFYIVGCASLHCFRDHLSEHLQLVKVEDIKTTMMGKIISDGQVS